MDTALADKNGPAAVIISMNSQVHILLHIMPKSIER